jgi:hypothetical protein
MISSQHKPLSFKDRQVEFTTYIRDPENNPAPDDVKKQRMEMYRTLIFNNVEGFISSNFPVLRKIFDDQPWKTMVQDFFNLHTCKTPYFSEIAEEFLHYLQYERESNPEDPPFLLELAHYEWVEMAASIAPEHLPKQTLDLEELNEDSLLKLSPLAWPLIYQYPVHKLSPEFQPATPPEQPTFLLVFRDRDDEVRFLELSPMAFQLLQLIEENDGILLSHCAEQLISQFNSIAPDLINKGILETIKEMAAKDIIFLTEFENH